MKQFISILILLTLSLSAQANFTFTDWKTEGDSKAVLDSATGIEWLRLTQTKGYSINGISQELSQGGKFQGWRLPTTDEVDSFATRFFQSSYSYMSFDSRTFRSGHYLSRAKSWGAWMGDGSRSAAHHRGLYVDQNGETVRRFGSYLNGSSYSIVYGLANSAAYSKDSTLSGRVGGVFLVSDGGTTMSSINDPQMNSNNPDAPVNVYAPATGALLGSLLMCIGLRRRTGSRGGLGGI